MNDTYRYRSRREVTPLSRNDVDSEGREPSSVLGARPSSTRDGAVPAACAADPGPRRGGAPARQSGARWGDCDVLAVNQGEGRRREDSATSRIFRAVPETIQAGSSSRAAIEHAIAALKSRTEELEDPVRRPPPGAAPQHHHPDHRTRVLQNRLIRSHMTGVRHRFAVRCRVCSSSYSSELASLCDRIFSVNSIAWTALLLVRVVSVQDCGPESKLLGCDWCGLHFVAGDRLGLLLIICCAAAVCAHSFGAVLGRFGCNMPSLDPCGRQPHFAAALLAAWDGVLLNVYHGCLLGGTWCS